jgi:hypothetical protein
MNTIPLSNYNNNNNNYDASSPVLNSQTNSTYCLLMGTPKTHKSINDSKSPMRKLKLKKSKRRECTPAYSPKMSKEYIYEGHNYAYTDKKLLFKENDKENVNMHKVSQRLSFDDISTMNTTQTQINNIPVNIPSTTLNAKKKFLSLIEESLNEVNDNYYGVLGSQTTPDTIFKTIFNDEKKLNVNMNEILFYSVNNILNALKSKKFEILSSMVY